MIKSNGQNDFNPQVGDFVTLLMWSDRKVFEVTGRTPKTATLRRVKATRSNAHEDTFYPGGFHGHYAPGKNGQQWDIEPDPEGDVITARWSQAREMWQHNGSKIIEGAHEHYDYNF